MKRKDMLLSGFLPRVPEDDSDVYEIIPICFIMLEVLIERYYYIHVPLVKKYMIDTRSAN